MEFDFEKLVGEAIKNTILRDPSPIPKPMWAEVALLFGLTPNDASKLCEHYKYDPDEAIVIVWAKTKKK